MTMSKENKGKGSMSAVVRVPVALVPWKSAMVVEDEEAVARQSLAVRRVVQDDDEDMAREFSLFSRARGDTLFTHSWIPIFIKVRGLVVLLHGLNEHGVRYNDFAKQLKANRFKVHGMDWIRHGGSDWLHAYVHSLDDAIIDMKMFLKKVLTKNLGLLCFCFGHSTVVAIVFKIEKKEKK